MISMFIDLLSMKPPLSIFFGFVAVYLFSVQTLLSSVL